MKRQLTTIGTILALSFIFIYIFSSNFGRSVLNVLQIIQIGASASLITFVGYVCFNYLFWRIKPVRQLFKRPFIHGVWIADLPDNQKLEIKISQQFYQVSVSLKGANFASKALLAQLLSENGGYHLYFIYISKPRRRKTLEVIHHGTCRLHCDESMLRGHYFTSDGTSQEILFYRKPF